MKPGPHKMNALVDCFKEQKLFSCKKTGYLKADCVNFKADQKQQFGLELAMKSIKENKDEEPSSERYVTLEMSLKVERDQSKAKEWCVDSGASFHMTKKIFSFFLLFATQTRKYFLLMDH